jgi:regulator of protease activity HflC (stomatin/prohibitin superfamily)
MRILRSQSPEGDRYGIRAADLAKYGGIALGALVVGVGIFVWFFCRIDVRKGEFCPLLRKTGKEISNRDVLAPTGEYKGPQFEILKEGRHFRNPYTWYWPRPMPATVVPPLKVGVMVRRYGEPLEVGQVIVRSDKQKGILADPLGPGRHYVNLWAYDVEIHDMVRIEPGFMGVVTGLVGKDPADPNVFVVKEGERGTQPLLLPPGTHPDYSNPYVYLVTQIDVRSQKFEMAGQYSITFPSKYGFDIRAEGTIEWAPDLEKLPELFVKYVDERDLQESGGINNIQRKIILPFARSYFRTIGGQFRAVDFITGSTRLRVQNEVEQRLRESCAREGIVIRAFVIRATEPPKPIREQYERREIAEREIDRFRKEIETEIGSVVMTGGRPKLDPDGEPVLDEQGRPVLIGGQPQIGPDGKPVREGGRLKKVLQERRKDREGKLGGVRERIAQTVRDAERYLAVETTKAAKQLAVAKIMLEAARDRAAKTLAEGKAEANVTVMKHQAEAEAVKAKVSAFRSGEKYAQYQLITKFSPGIRRILSNTEGLFARLFERFARIGTEAKKSN